MRRLVVHGATVAGALLMCAAALDAQGTQIPQAVPRTGGTPPVENCIAGRWFGITSYQCPLCNLSSPRDSTHVVHSFGAEPIVIETDNATNRIRPGDAVVAVNGNPITTRAGADQFAYPAQGTATITVRRNNVHITIEQLIQYRGCPRIGYFIFYPDSTGARTGVVAAARMGAGGGGGGGRGGRVGGAGGGGAGAFRMDSLAGQLDSARVLQRSTLDTSGRGRGTAGGQMLVRQANAEPISAIVTVRNFGLTLRCQPICTRARARDGTTMYWRFDGYPLIVTPSPASIAGKAGLIDGDVLLSVNGVSPQVEEGALLLNRGERELTLRLEVSRGGKREKITLKL